ncbi:MAG TPA: hypothetical protein VGM68_08715 [Rhizomicrobium sp.]|jgi:hypothetical protein
MRGLWIATFLALVQPSWATNTTASSDDTICDQLFNNLIPLQFSNVRYISAGRNLRNGKQYLGHKIIFTTFTLAPRARWGGVEFAFMSGTARTHEETTQYSGLLSSAGHVQGAAFAMERASDWPTYGARWDGKIALAASNGMPERQDRATIRVASVNGRRYIITTKPETVVAEIDPSLADTDNASPRFFHCPAKVGRRITADTDHVKHMLAASSWHWYAPGSDPVEGSPQMLSRLRAMADHPR